MNNMYIIMNHKVPAVVGHWAAATQFVSYGCELSFGARFGKILPHSARRKDLSYPKGIKGWAEEWYYNHQ